MMQSVLGAQRLLAIDDQGRVQSAPGPEPLPPDVLTRAFEALVCARLGVIGARTIATPNGHLGIMTLRERSGTALEFWAGAALRTDPASALCDAAADALLGRWHHSVIVAGAARLVAEGVCRAAMVIDDTGVAAYGAPTDFPPFSGPRLTPEPGARLAARTARGEFRALSLGASSVMLDMVPGTQNGRRIQHWFDALEMACI
jgi:hypothetical protein